MNTEIFKVSPFSPDLEVIKYAALKIRNGALVVFPTETVYGLACNGFDDEGVKKVFEAKGRPQDNPLILHISEVLV